MPSPNKVIIHDKRVFPNDLKTKELLKSKSCQRSLIKWFTRNTQNLCRSTMEQCIQLQRNSAETLLPYNPGPSSSLTETFLEPCTLLDPPKFLSLSEHTVIDCSPFPYPITLLPGPELDLRVLYGKGRKTNGPGVYRISIVHGRTQSVLEELVSCQSLGFPHIPQIHLECFQRCLRNPYPQNILALCTILTKLFFMRRHKPHFQDMFTHSIL